GRPSPGLAWHTAARFRRHRHAAAAGRALMTALHELARAAGLQIAWRDVYGTEQIVSDDSLRAVLAALELPAGTDSEIRDSLATLRAEMARDITPPLVTAT